MKNENCNYEMIKSKKKEVVRKPVNKGFLKMVKKYLKKIKKSVDFILNLPYNHSCVVKNAAH